MRPYNPAEPLIFIHVPKTAGTSVREIFRGWFGAGLIEHYRDEQRDSLPPKRDLRALQGAQSLVVYGHFNKYRGFGIQDYYPEVSQFVTILRDPFERAISGYLFVLRQPPSRFRTQLLEDDIRSHLLDRPAGGAMAHMPGFLTADNYREVFERHFVGIGVVERLGESVARMAAALGRSFDLSQLPRLNANPDPVPEELLGLREEFIRLNPVEYEIYNYALERLGGSA